MRRHMNGPLYLETFPKVWKDTYVIMIPKPGQEHALHANYRPISLASCMAEVEEAVILSRLRGELFAIEAIMEEKFGFRAGLSTDHPLFKLMDEIWKSLESRVNGSSIS